MTTINRSFFAFPLELLAFGDNFRSRLYHAVSYAVVSLAERLRDTVPLPQLQAAALAVPETDRPVHLQDAGSLRYALAVARWQLQVIKGSAKEDKKQYSDFWNFHYDWVERHGKSPIVQLANDFVWDCINGRLSYRELSVLAAVYSAIGAKRYPVRITRRTIQHRSLGYKTPAVMKAELHNRTDGAGPLSIDQIGRTLDKLHERNLFARARANARQTYYSLTLRQNELEAALLRSKTYSRAFHATRRTRDATLMARIAEAGRSFSGLTPQTPCR